MQLVAKTNELKNAAMAKQKQIGMALMLGGFSSCKPLLDQIRAQFNIQIEAVGEQASVAIVKGATFTDVPGFAIIQEPQNQSQIQKQSTEQVEHVQNLPQKIVF